ncbi:hypothetical protein HN935_01905 [archaeon]|nr:hypothetical protein [archaeon]
MRWTILFLLIFLMSIATAAPTLTFQHNETQPGETIIATITTAGEFSEQIEPSSISFYEGRRQVSFESDITFYKGTHHIYVYTTREGNFSIQIENILYKEADELKEKTIKQNFTIKEKTIINEETNETSTEILSIKPGFIFTTQTPIIKLINKGTTPLNITYNETEFPIESLGTKEITLAPTEVFSTLTISSYKEFSIPIIYPAANSTFVSPSEQIDLRQTPELLLTNIFTNTESQETIELFNFGDKNITDMQVSPDFAFINTEPLENMPARGVQNLTLTFNPENPGHFKGNINITYTQYEKQNTLSVPVSLFVLPEGSEESGFEVSEQTCAEIFGTVCGIKETCNGEFSFTKGGEYCCMAECKEVEEEEAGTSYGWIWAIVIFIVIGAGAYYFYRRQKKIAPNKPEDQLKETAAKFAKRMEGTKETKRIKGGLTKS